MIVNIRGTSGAGKSTLVRSVMERYQSKEPVLQTGRRQPFGYFLDNKDHRSPLYVPGHYETACGGCDTIAGNDVIFNSVKVNALLRHDVLFEGIMVQDAALDRMQELNTLPNTELVVITLTTPIEECLRSVQARRDARGEVKPLNPKNTVDRAKRVKKNVARLRNAGIKVEEWDREGALKRTLELLGWPN